MVIPKKFHVLKNNLKPLNHFFRRCFVCISIRVCDCYVLFAVLIKISPTPYLIILAPRYLAGRLPFDDRSEVQKLCRFDSNPDIHGYLRQSKLMTYRYTLGLQVVSSHDTLVVGSSILVEPILIFNRSVILCQPQFRKEQEQHACPADPYNTSSFHEIMILGPLKSYP